MFQFLANILRVKNLPPQISAITRAVPKLTQHPLKVLEQSHRSSSRARISLTLLSDEHHITDYDVHAMNFLRNILTFVSYTHLYNIPAENQENE